MKPEDQVKDSGRVVVCGMAPMKPDSGVVTDPRVTPPDKVGLYYAGEPATFSIPTADAPWALRAFGPMQEYEANPLLKLMMKNAAAQDALMVNGAAVPLDDSQVARFAYVEPPIGDRILALKAAIGFCTATIDRLTATRASHEQQLAQLQGIAPLTTVKEPFPVRALRDWVG